MNLAKRKSMSNGRWPVMRIAQKKTPQEGEFFNFNPTIAPWGTPERIFESLEAVVKTRLRKARGELRDMLGGEGRAI